ncbi:MAG: N-acetylmuramoyl-L-alanine amidase-like domain-containing protein [Bacteroidales bacterium]
MDRLIILLTITMVVSCHGPSFSGNHNDVADRTSENEIKYSTTSGDSLFFDGIKDSIKNLLEPSDPVNKRLKEIGRAFMRTPYVAGTLEAEGDERLIINLLGVDCTTFVEYVTAMAICSQKDKFSFGDFASQLAKLRYRNGIPNGYPSRLHYFSDWLKVNEQKGYLSIISDDIGNADMDMQIDFMTTNSQYYIQILDNPVFLQDMKVIEKEIRDYDMRYISKDVIDKMSPMILDGDIIAFVTTVEGLDVSHTGLAIHQDGKLHLLHASLRSKEVEITLVPLSEYLKGLGNVSGILVARLSTP